MMSVDLKKLNDIDEQTKFTIYGYIREHQSSFASEEYNIFNNIPDLIPSLCILYFDSGDRFGIIGEAISYVDGDKTTILMVRSAENKSKSNCYGTVIIPSDSKSVYKWDMKLIKVPRSDETCIAVGVTSTKRSIDSKSSYKLGDNYYIYSNFGWYRDHGKRYRSSVDYRKRQYYTGYFITITLDMKAKTVSFYNHTAEIKLKIDMNGFEGYECQLVVTALKHQDTSVRIDKFTQTLLE